MNHSPACFQMASVPCSSSVSLSGEEYSEHAWSGYPNATCLKCGVRDSDELCLDNECKCHCHDGFWQEFGARRIVTPSGVKFRDVSLGFSIINPDVQKTLAGKAGKKAHQLKRAHEYNSKTGHAARRIGGKSLYEKYGAEYMARIGQRGGKNRKAKGRRVIKLEWVGFEWVGLALSFGDKFRDLFSGLEEK